MSTTFPADHRVFRTFGKLRHTDLFDTSRWPSSVRSKARSHQASVSVSLIEANPTRCQVTASHSKTNVLIRAEWR